MILKRKDVLGLEDLSPEEILGILDIAAKFRTVFDRPVRKVPAGYLSCPGVCP